MLGAQKVFFNLDKNLFKWNEGKSSTVFILVGSEREGIFDMGFYKKSAHVVVKFCAYISLGALGSQKLFFNLVKDLLNEMRSRVLIWGAFEKSTHVVVKFCAYIGPGMLGSQKMLFNLVMNLFKWNDGESSSVCILVGSETEGIFDLDFLRKKNSCRCRILKFCVYISLGMLGSQKYFSIQTRTCSNEMRAKVGLYSS